MGFPMLSLTGEYALRAIVYLTQNAERCPIPGREIAEEAGIPAKYLSKILGDLVRHGVLNSSRGKSGGFRLRRSAQETMLYDVLRPFEQFDPIRCPFGNDRCNEEDPCLAHTQWKHVVETERRFLLDTSVYDVAVKAPKSMGQTLESET